MKGEDTAKNKAKNTKEKTDVALREEAVLAFWKEHNIFEKSLKKKAPNGEFVFYDGPPFATGLPHSGSLLSSVSKDLIPRYKTMRGYHVRRRWGWDCHGLPIENMIEKELGLKSKKDIEELGVDKFNQACRDSVLKFDKAWKEYIDKVGRWVDLDNSYKTMDNTYIESVWWGLKQIYEKGLLYEGRKVLLYCPHCETPLAKAEVNMDSDAYRDITEESVTLRFKVKDPKKHDLPKNTSLLAWTTTPWTLPGNVALAVGEDIEYVLLERDDENVILAKDIYEKDEALAQEHAVVLKTVKGKDLIGIEYESLYLLPEIEKSGKKAHYVAAADFVTTEEGTGIVHTAVIYGEDDYELGLELDLPMVPILTKEAHFDEKAPKFIQGKYFKQSEKFIKEDLEKRGLMFKKEDHTHSYPHCHRCGTQLLYNAITSWFIAVQKIKQKLIDNNEKVTWFPEHLKHGRFLHNLESAPDWTISRNRYWASPMPIWRNTKTDNLHVIGSLEEFKSYVPKSGNKYFLMRHGEAEHNAKNITSSNIKTPHHLTDKGKEQIKEATKKMKCNDIHLVIASPFIRTKETALYVAKECGLKEADIVFDDRIGEINTGEFDGRPVEEYWKFWPETKERFVKRPKDGENLHDVLLRMGEFLYDVESKHRNKNILIITHDTPSFMLYAVSCGCAREELVRLKEENEYFIKNAEIKEIDFSPIPHNHDYELDLHRPYIDEIDLIDTDGAPLVRVPEVIDGWVESGSMPFAEYHYPFENKEVFKKRFPGDFISEYIAQTRTWFYYMHVVGTALFDSETFKNVTTTGNILAEDGSKMSKSKKNYTDPLELIALYGADAFRYYTMTSVVMQGEDLRFTDNDVKEIQQRLINILSNVYTFYALYADENKNSHDPKKSNHVLDTWILARLNELTENVTTHLDTYNTVKAGRPIRDFITDFSTWYVRRSRDRFKAKSNLQDSVAPRPFGSGDDEEDKQYALATMRYVLVELSKIIAPYMPFISEHMYRELRYSDDPESVHLCSWPETRAVDEDVLKDMQSVRDIVSLALEVRAKENIKVRQPLAELRVKNRESGIQNNEQLLDLIKDEVNIKDVVFDSSIENNVQLDTTITPELRAEGDARELIRYIQSERKNKGLTPKEEIRIAIGTTAAGKEIVEKYKDEIMRTTNATEIAYEETEGTHLKIGDYDFTIGFTIR